MHCGYDLSATPWDTAGDWLCPECGLRTSSRLLVVEEAVRERLKRAVRYHFLAVLVAGLVTAVVNLVLVSSFPRSPHATTLVSLIYWFGVLGVAGVVHPIVLGVRARTRLVGRGRGATALAITVGGFAAHILAAALGRLVIGFLNPG
jgi:hypothetical protein